ncbi:GNAT family N-acetyltransferase [Azotosporobacter soli]|uniref:GNAT family N-acetyltransferase n=1 Tax=Azotosporobacter soli TaxID=3055040 RepID=UPI0031FF0CDA
MSNLLIRGVRYDDVVQIAAIEKICFPAAEAAGQDSFAARIAAFPDSFFVAEFDGAIIGFINGCATNSPVLYDELFHDATQHLPDGENLTVFGLDVLPECRRQGIAARLMRHFIETARKNGKKRVLLTCKEALVPYYASFGYKNDGLSASTHGGAEWFDMTLTL